MIDLQLQPLSSVPLYEQVHGKIKSKIENGCFDSSGRLPSIKSLSLKNALSTLTINRAYRYLQKEGYIEFVSGKGYFITDKSLNRKQKVLVVLNNFSFDKESIYYTLIDALGENKKVDLHVNHCNPPDFDNVLHECLSNKYNYYVLMPCFLNSLNTSERDKIIQVLPQEKIVFVDQPLGQTDNSNSFIFQSFKAHIKATLRSAEEVFTKYKRVEIILAKSNKYPTEIILGFEEFSSEINKTYTIKEKIVSENVTRGAVYIVTKGEDLLSLLKIVKVNRLQIGKDIGIISFIETDLSEFLGITAIYSDWKLIAKEASELIINKQYKQQRNPFELQRRLSL